MLCELNTAFYQRTSASFSATRERPWPGWERVTSLVDEPADRPLRVLDLACGNLRFERFLAERVGAFEAWCVDNCDALVEMGRETLAAGGYSSVCTYQRLDVADVLLSGEDLGARIEAPPCDLCVAFGFLHHIPTAEMRARVLQALVTHARPGALVAVSFWQFMQDARLAGKAVEVSQGDPGDYLLGWQDDAQARRYCHSFTEEEIDRLAASVARDASEVARFSADGRAPGLNRYLILTRHSHQGVTP